MDIEIHPSAVCEPGAAIGEGCRIWHFCHVMSGAKLGRDCMLGQGCFVASGVVVGDRVRLQNHVSLFSGVTLEDDVFCGPGVVFTNVKRPRAFVDQSEAFLRTVVRQGASLGANCTLCPGIEVGAFAMVGAGAVVTRDIPQFAEMRGNPARLSGWVNRLGQPLEFDEFGSAHSGAEQYRLIANKTSKTADGSFRVELVEAHIGSRVGRVTQLD